MPATRSLLAIVATFLVSGALAAQPAPRVDRFGDPLPPGALFRIGTSRLQLDRQLQAIAASPDGKLVAAVSDGMLGVWETAGGREVLRRAARGNGFLAFSADGKLIAFNTDLALVLFDLTKGQERAKLGRFAHAGNFAADGKTLVVRQDTIAGIDMETAAWDVLSGKLMNDAPTQCELHPGFPDAWLGSTSALSPDCKLLVSTQSRDKPPKQVVSLNDVASGKLIRRWELESPTLRALVFSRDGRLVAGASANAVCRVWDVATGNERACWKVNDGIATGGFGFAFAPDGASVLCTQSSGIARWNWQTGKIVQEFPNVGGPIAFPAHCNTMAVQSSLGSIRLLDLDSHKDLCPLPRSGNHVAFSADGPLVAWSEGSEVVLAEARSGKEMRRWQAHVRYVGPLAFAPDGKTLASAGTDRRIRVWDIASGRELRSMIKNGVDTLFFAPDNKRLVSASFNEVCLWDATSGERHGQWTARTSVVMAPNARTIAVPDAKKTDVLRLLDPLTGKQLGQVPGYYAQFESLIDMTIARGRRDFRPGFAPVFSSDGQRIVVGGRGGSVEQPRIVIGVWDVAAGKKLPLELVHREFDVRDVTFSPNALLLAALRADRKMCLISTHSGEIVRVLGTTEDNAWPSPSFTPDGRMLVTATRGLVQFWEVATGGEIARQPAHRDDVRELVMSANGRILATTSWDHATLIWDLARLATADRPRDAAVAADELPGLWADLASPKSNKGWRAVETLLAAPGPALALLRERLKPAAQDPKLAAWVADLGSDDFDRRQQAEQELDRVIDTAAPALRKAVAGNLPIEARRRIETLLKKLDPAAVPAGDALRAVRAVQVLEGLANPEAIRLLQELAQGAAGARLTDDAAAALGRLKR